MARDATPVQKRPRFDWRASFASVEPVLQGAGFQFTFVLLFVLVNAVLFVAGAAPEWRRAIALRRPLAARLAICAARGSGALLNVNSALVVLFAARRLMTFLRATMLNMVVPFDKAMPHFHTLVGHVLVYSSAVHVLGHTVNYSILRLWTPGFHGYRSLLGTGVLLTAVIVAMRVTVLPWIRRKRFELFYYTHIAGFVGYYTFLIIHGSHNGVMSSWKFVTIPLAIYIIDRISRLLHENVARLEIAQSTGEIISGNVVCLRLRRAFRYKAGQYADIKVPAISNVEWHPFTIASSPNESEMLFFIKRSGDWTEKLYNLFANPPEIDDDEDVNLEVHIRGPFGAPAQHVGQYEHVVLIGGGVGATPFASIAKYAHNWILDYTERGAKAGGISATKSVSAAFAHSHSVARASADGLQVPQSSSNINLFGDADPPRKQTPQAAIASGGRRLARNVSSRLKLATSNSRQDLSRVSSYSHGNNALAASASTNGSFVPGDPEPSLEQGIYLTDRTKSSPSYADPLSLHSQGFPPAELGFPGSSSIGSGQPPSLSLPTAPSSGFLDRTASSSASQALLFESAGTVSSSGADYPEGLGDPDAPLVSRRSRAVYHSASSSAVEERMVSTPSFNGRLSNGRHQLEVVREYDSTQDLFASDDDLDEDDDEEEAMVPSDPSSSTMHAVRKRPQAEKGTLSVQSNENTNSGSPGRGDYPTRGGTRNMSAPLQTDVHGRENDGDESLVSTGATSEGWEYENMLLRDVPLESNAANLMGVSFGSTAMMEHLMNGDRKMGAGMRRASLNVMEEAFDQATWEERALFYLHTVTANWFLLWIMLVRYSIAVLDAIVNGFEVRQKGLAVFEAPALIWIDLALALLLAFPVNFAVALELRLHGMASFFSESYGNVFDILLLVPLSAGCVVLSVLALFGVGTEVQHVSNVTLILFWPTMSFLLLWRIGRTVGPRIMLAQHRTANTAHTKSLDFIFVSKRHSDDQWLVKEMLPLTSAKIVRLHRYITQDEEGEPELWAQDHETRPLQTVYRRPHFDDVFSGIAARSKSGSVIGVFYCCPPAMGRSIQQGATKAMAKSLAKAYRCGYMQAMNERNNGENGQNLSEAARYGCNVKFALREENFG